MTEDIGRKGEALLITQQQNGIAAFIPLKQTVWVFVHKNFPFPSHANFTCNSDIDYIIYG